MTLQQNIQQRALMHNRRSKRAVFQKRDVPALVKAKLPDPITLPTKPVVVSPPKVTPDPKSTSSSLPATTSSAPSSPSSASSAASSSSSVTSSSSSVIVQSTPSVLSTPSSSSTTARVRPTTTPRVVDPTTGSASSSVTAAASSKSVAATTSGLGTGTLIGIIGGGIIGVALVCMVVAFFLRRFRKKRRGAEAFNSSDFRRSAVLLDEKDQQPDFRPRPPSMIERRNAQPSPPSTRSNANDIPPPPSMYGAGPGGSEHGHGQYSQYGPANPQYGTLPPPPPPSQTSAYSAIPGAYGVPPPGAFGAHYDQAGFGAPPVPGTYAPGAYAPYGAPDPRYPHPQYQYQQQQPRYLQQSGYQQHPAQHAAYGQRMDSLSASSNSAASEKQALRLASSTEESSESSSAGSSLTRQPTQSSGAPPAYVDDGIGAKLAARSDMKVKPVVLSAPETGSSSTAPPVTLTVTPAEGEGKANGARPVSAYSAYSLYDQEDAYGGM